MSHVKDLKGKGEERERASLGGIRILFMWWALGNFISFLHLVLYSPREGVTPGYGNVCMRTSHICGAM